MTANWFMDLELSRQYSYMYWMEDDVRLGGNWVDFFQNVNSSIPGAIRDRGPRDIPAGAPILDPLTAIPDLITFSPIAAIHPVGPGPYGRPEGCLNFVPWSTGNVKQALIMMW